MASQPLPPLTARAMSRLQKLMDGNGDPNEGVRLIGTEEKTYVLEGIMKLEPIAETAVTRYAGNARGKAQVFPGTAALRAEVERRQKAFRDNPQWIPAAVKQLKEQNAGGWGMDNVRITLPDQNALLAASEMCPTCQGQKMMVCATCHGQGTSVCAHCAGSRQEFCYNCAGRGVSPANPNQPCNICNGRRYIPCRFCQATGQMTCPACQGKRGTTCTSCNGAGSLTEEVTLTCGARTHFQLAGNSELPSGLRRGLDRLGIVNLPNGYGDVTIVEAPKPQTDYIDAKLAAPPGLESEFYEEGETPKKQEVPEVHYRASLPYADIRISFNGKAVLVSAFGKKGSLMGVPTFLDTALESAREALRQTAQGQNHFNEATKTRLMRDALALLLTGSNTVNDLRRIYPLGLSAEVAAEILANMRRALNNTTKSRRILVAVLCMIASAALFGGVFMTDIHAMLTQNLLPMMQLGVDIAVLGTALLVSWFVLSSSAALALRKRFDGKTALLQSTGKAGAIMAAGITALFAAAVALAPVKPMWLSLLHH